jgi:putative flippase GtrA
MSVARSQMVRFLWVGLFNTAVTMLAFIFFMNIGFHYITASGIAWLIAMANSFVLNKYFTFQDATDISARQVWSHLGSQISQLVLAWIIYAILIDFFKMSAGMSYLLNALVTTALNFLVFKWFIFRGPKKLTLPTPFTCRD